MMTEISDRVKEQLEQFNTTLDQVINASRGLYLLIKEESNKQFSGLVEAGEAQKAAEADGAESLLAQLTKDVSGQFDDVKGSISSIRSASLLQKQKSLANKPSVILLKRVKLKKQLRQLNK